MTFQRVDSLRGNGHATTVGAHLLEVAATDTGLCWELRCGACLALLARDVLEGSQLLAGVLAVPATGGARAVSWAWGTPPAAADATVEVVFSRGWRQPAVTAAHRLTPGLWGAAIPGLAHAAIVVTGPLPELPAVSEQRRAHRLPYQPCAGWAGWTGLSHPDTAP